MNESKRRSDLPPFKEYKKIERLEKQCDGYYYHIRESGAVGPFMTLSAARFDLNNYLQSIKVQQEFNVDNVSDTA